MALLNGIFNTASNPAELNMRSFAATLLRLFPNGSAPLFALTSQLGKSTAKAATHGYFTKTMAFVKTTFTSGDVLNDVAGASVTLTIASSAGMVAGAVLRNATTAENVRVTSVTNATTIVVTRSFGRIAAAAMTAADVLIQVGTAFEEGSNRPTARGLSVTYVPNYTQIFRNAWGLTDTARASMSEMGYSNVAENRKDCAVFHSTDIEAAIIWGQPEAPAVGPGGQLLHATQGILDAIEQYAPGNSNAAGATTTFAQLVALLEPMFAYSTDLSNAKERVVFVDAHANKVLNDIGRLSGQVYITQNENSFGMQFSKFKFYKGMMTIVEHPLMNALTADATKGNAIVMDMPALKLAYLNGRDTWSEEYGVGKTVVENGVDGIGGSLNSEFAVELINPFACGIITNLTAAA